MQPPTPKAAGIQQRMAVRLLVIAMGALLWAGCYVLFTRHNAFPADYHPDEPGKGLQIQQGRRNYRHPQMLLELSTIALKVSGNRSPLGRNVDANDPAARTTIQQAVVVGRHVSAALGAGAVVVFFWLAWRSSGWAAAVLQAALLGTCPTLLINAHFMKEDTALLFGLAVVLSAIYYAWNRRAAPHVTRVRAAWLLGAAVCLVASGKYVGIIAVLPAIWVLLSLRGRSPADTTDTPTLTRKRLIGIFLLAATLTSFIINWRVFKNPGSWVEAVGNQLVDGVVEHGGLTMAKPNSYYLRTLWQILPAPVLVLAVAAAICGLIALVRRGDRWWAILGFAPLVYLAMLCFASAPNHRHALPVVALAMFSASLFAAKLATWLLRKPAVVALIFTALAVAWSVRQWPTLAAINAQFGNDSRAQAAVWLSQRVSPSDVILQDAADMHIEPALAGANRPRVLPYEFACEAGDFAAVRQAGVTYIVTCDLSYGRYFDPMMVPTKSFQAEYARRRQWYTSLFTDAELLWSAKPAVPTHAPSYPEIRIYRLRKP